MSKWIEHDGSVNGPNIIDKVFIREGSGWKSQISEYVHVWNWGDFVTHYRIDDGTKEENEVKENKESKIFIVVIDGGEACTFDNEVELNACVHNVIKQGNDPKHIKIYEAVYEKSVKIVIE